MPQPGSIEASARFLSAMLGERESAPRAQLLARQAADSSAGRAAIVYLLTSDDPTAWKAKATAGEIVLDGPTVPIDAGHLGTLAQQREPLLFSGKDLMREDYAHLHARRTLVSLAYVPMIFDEDLIGALEVASFDSAIDDADLQELSELVKHAAPAFVSAIHYEEERNSQLESISRLTQLYDLEKVFSSTLEMEELKPLITAKIREVLDAQAVNLWFVKDQDELLLIQQAGNDPTATVNSSQRTGEGYVAAVSDSGEPVLINLDEDNAGLLKKRNPLELEGGPFSVIVCPLVAREKLVGVVECINKMDGKAFDEDHLFLLNAISETAAIALNNAGLLQAERKVEILQTLVQVSGEITSTLNLDRVLQAVVNTPSAVIPYERASIALDERGKLRMKAISGMEQVNFGAREVTQLEGVIPFVWNDGNAATITQHGDLEQGGEIRAPQEAMKAPFAKYFTDTGMRGFYALPLADDEGRLGILLFESSDPDFLSEAHREMIRVVAAQATVAVRNASLYKEVPFISLLGPMLQRKQKFLALEKRRRTLFLAGAAAIIVFLCVFPIPMRVDGVSTVASARSIQVQPELDGVVSKVFVREGQHVQKGDVIADLEDWDYRAALAQAQAKYQTASMEANRALSTNDGALAGEQSAQARYWGSELERARERLERTHLRALMDGSIVTPHVEDFVGRHLATGETLAEISDSSQARVDVAIDQSEVSLLRAGDAAAVKVESYPTQTFRGHVALVSPKSQAEGDNRFFYARVDVPNPDARLRPGMQGRGKVSVGWHPIGYVFFRSTFLWIYSKFWSWFGW
jgi:RND family efflux transporter MFP subunit